MSDDTPPRRRPGLGLRPAQRPWRRWRSLTDVRFEHSPRRGHPGFTADHTAFDVLLHCTTPQGRSAFVAIASGCGITY